MTKFLCGECIHNSDKGGGCLIPKNLGYVDNCNRYLPKDKPIVQTNEEYLRSCNTEELAEFLDFLLCADSFCEVCDINETCEIGDRCKYGEEEHEKCFMKWLKQPHTKE